MISSAARSTSRTMRSITCMEVGPTILHQSGCCRRARRALSASLAKALAEAGSRTLRTVDVEFSPRHSDHVLAWDDRAWPGDWPTRQRHERLLRGGTTARARPDFFDDARGKYW